MLLVHIDPSTNQTVHQFELLESLDQASYIPPEWATIYFWHPTYHLLPSIGIIRLLERPWDSWEHSIINHKNSFMKFLQSCNPEKYLLIQDTLISNSDIKSFITANKTKPSRTYRNRKSTFLLMESANKKTVREINLAQNDNKQI